MSALLDQIVRSAAADPDLAAVISPDRVLRYGELPLLAAIAANRLNFADPDGGAVAILLPDCVDWTVAHLGARQLDRTTITATPDLAPDQLAHGLAALGATSALTPFGLITLRPRLYGDSAAHAVTLIGSDAGDLSIGNFTEEMIREAGRSWIRCPDARGPLCATTGLPTAIVDVYGHASRREPSDIQPWLTHGVAGRWAEALLQRECALLAY